MCTRFVLLERHYRDILQQLGIDAAAAFLTRYNIGPGSAIPALRNKPGKAGREAVTLRWGLAPSWAKSDEGTKLANARAETLGVKPSFRDAVRTRRCVIPASGFYEWEHRGRAKQPWLFRRRDEQPFGFAGLWESWRDLAGSTLETCTIITTEPNELMRPLHHRMPVMLSPGQFEPWLDPRVTELAALAPLLDSPRAETISAIAVSTYVSSIRNEGPACLTPATGEANGAPQFSLDL